MLIRSLLLRWKEQRTIQPNSLGWGEEGHKKKFKIREETRMSQDLILSHGTASLCVTFNFYRWLFLVAVVG